MSNFMRPTDCLGLTVAVQKDFCTGWGADCEAQAANVSQTDLMKPHTERGRKQKSKAAEINWFLQLAECYHREYLSGRLIDEHWEVRSKVRTPNMSFTQEEKCWPSRQHEHVYHCHVHALLHYDIQITRLFQTHPSLLLQPLRHDREEARWYQSSLEHRVLTYKDLSLLYCLRCTLKNH